MNSLSCFLEKTLPYLHTTFPFIIERNSHNQKKASFINNIENK